MVFYFRLYYYFNLEKISTVLHINIQIQRFTEIK